MKKLLFAVLLFCGALNLSAACSVKEFEDDNGSKCLLMENSRIKVVLMPGSNGRIAELAIKEEDDERHFFAEVEFSTVEVGNGISLVGKTNYAGLEDWGWEEGLIKKNVPYKAEIIKNTADEATVKMSAVFSTWADVERLITITRDSAVVKLEVKFTNVSKNPIDRTYWQHIMIDFDRTGDHSGVRMFIPVKQTGENGKVLGVAYLQQPGKTCVLERPATSSNPKAQDYSRLAQPWRAMVNEDLLFGMVVDFATFRQDAAAYHFNLTALSCENVFSKMAYKPGESHVFRSQMIASYAPARVDYMDSNIVLGCARNMVDGKLEMDISAYRTGALKNLRLSFSAADNNGKVLETVSCDAVLPASGDAFAKKLIFKKAQADSRFFVEISADGKNLAKSELLPQIKW